MPTPYQINPHEAAVTACQLLGIEATTGNIERVLNLRQQSSYRDTPGVVNRANSAMLRIEQIIEDRACPSEIRLVRIAEVMAQEPVLTDDSTAAARARRDAARWTARRTVYVEEG